MKEWNDQVNPFNSMKALVWADHLMGCAKGEFLPPVTVAIDPTTKCNYNCIWCNAFDVRQNKAEMSKEHLIKLADFFKSWGVKSTCIAGGGEPLMNKYTVDFIKRCYINGLSNSVITNGSFLNDNIIDVVANECRWIGFSMDAGTVETYNSVKGITNNKIFPKLINDITKLCDKINKNNNICDVGYKFLLHPYNQHEIIKAAKLAKECGVNDFQVRPVGMDNITLYRNKEKPKFDYNLINEQLEKIFLLEDENFHVYGIRHKYSDDLRRKINYKKCWASPLHPAFCADGNVHLCIDMRGKEELILCSHDPDPAEILKHWGTDKHKEILDNINVAKCTKCTFAGYNEIIEKAFVGDKLCRNHI